LKSPQSIIEKAKKYIVTLDGIPYKIKDIAGVRFVTQFEEDIFLLWEMITRRSGMRVVEVKDYFSNPKRSGYKSFHVIIEYDVNTVDGLSMVLCEIQLRTLAMDFWASIEHSLNYKYRNEVPPQIRSRL